MESIFRVILNMSVTGSYVIVAVCVLRLLLRKAPKWISYALWAVVLFRLVCPISFESSAALIPDAQPIPQEFFTAQTPEIHTGLPFVNAAVNPMLRQSAAGSPAASANPAQILFWSWGWTWLLIAIGLLLYALFTTVKFRKRIRFATLLESGVYESDQIGMAFVYGLIKPRIYIPAGLSEEQRTHILLHERAHIRRFDHIFKPLSFLVLAAHWFNPLAWLAFLLFGKDMELSCDESVMRRAQGDIRQAYSATLLHVSSSRSALVAPLAFGESGTKLRIKNVLQYRKPAFWAIAAVIVVMAAAAVVLLANPVVLPVNTITEKPLTQAEHDSIAVQPQRYVYRYAYHVDDSIKSACIYVERWQSGAYESTWGRYVLPVTAQKGEILLSQGIQHADIAFRGIEWMLYDASGAGIGFTADLPKDFMPNASASQFLFGGEEEGVWPVTAEEPVILGGVVFNTKPELRAYDCQTLMQEPERLAEYEYIFLIKCVFSAKEASALQEETNGTDIGIIGGADGPTSIMIEPGREASVSEIGPDSEFAIPEKGDAVAFVENGKIVRLTSILDNAEYQKIVDDAIFNSMIRSAAWPAVDIGQFTQRIDIYRAPVGDDTEYTIYHVFLQDGRPCMQTRSMWTYISEDVYYPLYTLAVGGGEPTSSPGA